MRIIFNYINKLIVSWLQKPIKKYESTSEFKIKDLEEVMQPGDIFLAVSYTHLTLPTKA